MKNIKRFSAVIGAAALLAFAFTGCDTFAGTEVNYSEKEIEKTGATGVLENLSTASVTSLLINGSYNYIGEASSQTTVEITITNNATSERINLSSFKKAVKFYKLTDSKEKDARLHYQRDGELPVKVFGESDTSSTAKLELEVDTSSVTTESILLVIDAKTLKDKQGKLILNTDNNNKRGEDSDTILRYITVNNKAGGTEATDSLVGIEEDNRHIWSPFTAAPDVVELKDDDSKYTGEYEIRISTYKYAQNTLDDDLEYNTGLASILNDAFYLRVKKPGSSTPSTEKLSFTWYENEAKTEAYYKSQAVKYDVGTKFEVMSKNVDFSKYVPAWHEEKYGYKAFIAHIGFGAKSSASATETVTRYISCPDYIIDTYSTTEEEWTIRSRNKDNIKTAQQSFLNATSFDGRFCKVYLNGDPLTKPGDIEISGKDFIIVDSNNSIEYKLPFKMTEKYYDGDAGEDYAGKLEYIQFEITNKNITLKTPHLYVGSGVTLTSENKRNATQVKFGQFKDTADGIHSGYVALN